MKKIVILGAGTAGIMMANHLIRKIDKKEWSITIIDQHKTHYYQPGFLFIPFDYYSEKNVTKDKKDFIPKKVEYIQKEIEVIKPGLNRVKLKDGELIDYHILIIATGAKIVPEEIEGLTDDGWRKNVFDFYTIEGATALREKFKTWKGGKLVVYFAEMPIKCPVAPLEFTFLADWFLTKNGIRQDVEITYVTPLPGAFTKKNCSLVLGHLLGDKSIKIITDFGIERVDENANRIISYDEKEVDYDLLVTVPTNMGDDVIARSALGDDLNFIFIDMHMLQSKSHENIFVIGDATDLPSSKAGSVAHFQSEILTKNIMNFMDNKSLINGFDGYANCFIESGFGKAFLIDFNYDYEPVEGRFPVPILGLFPLLKESRLNHLGKLAFRWIYWNLLLKGRLIPGISTKMSKLGKKLPK
ncbi:NAD(P)/FAD-dependent oxidoreductase [Acidobacteriota bacterium]